VAHIHLKQVDSAITAFEMTDDKIAFGEKLDGCSNMTFQCMAMTPALSPEPAD
jgi:hypothetical protein